MARRRRRAGKPIKYRAGAAARPGRVRERVERAEATISTTMRLRGSLRMALERWAERDRRSVSDVAQELLEEGLRMRACPGIYFSTEPTGRTAKVAGTGLAVWEVLRDYVRDRDAEAVQAAFSQLSPSQRRAALLYFSTYPDEVRAAVQHNAALTPEAIEARHPGQVRVVRAD